MRIEVTMNFQNFVFQRAYGLSETIPESTLPEIVFCGRSNVGKSSLINKTVNRKKLARTSSEPGKTATVNFYTNGEINLVDLPGYGFANKSKSEKERFSSLIGGYFSKERDIALVLVLIDVRHAPSALDMSMIDFLIDSELPFCIVFTKCDKLSNSALKERMKSFSQDISCFADIHSVMTSSEKGTGIETVKEYIEESLG